MADTRKRVFAFVVYQDSAPNGWISTLSDYCVQGYWVYHDKDINPDGEKKKPHFHVMLYFDGKKSEAQVLDLLKKCAANGQMVDLVSPVGYARYLCHLDNPDKHQYGMNEVYVLGGFTPYADYVSSSADIDRTIMEMEDLIDEMNFYTFYAFSRWCRSNRTDWHYLLVNKCSYYIDKFIKSRTWAVTNSQI